MDAVSITKRVPLVEVNAYAPARSSTLGRPVVVGLATCYGTVVVTRLG